MQATSTLLVFVGFIAASIWTGGMVCIALVAKVAREVLDERSQVAFFRSVGRRYGIVGTVSLLVATAAGLALSWPPSGWTGPIGAAIGLAGVLIIATALGMMQARIMTARRRELIENPDDRITADALRRGRMLANGLRGMMALLTIAILALGSYVLVH